MMKFILVFVVCFLSTSNVFARDDNKNKEKYRSSTGTKYQYDLSNPSDELRYELDLKAQMRDELSVNPKRELDRDLGQVGGGISDDLFGK